MAKKKKARKNEKRADAGFLRTTIRNVKNEISCLQGRDDCQYRLEQLLNVTLPKLEHQLGRLGSQRA